MKLLNKMQSPGMYLPFDYHEPSQRGSARGVSLEMMMVSSYLPIRRNRQFSFSQRSEMSRLRRAPALAAGLLWANIAIFLQAHYPRFISLIYPGSL